MGASVGGVHGHRVLSHPLAIGTCREAAGYQSLPILLAAVLAQAAQRLVLAGLPAIRVPDCARGETMLLLVSPHRAVAPGLPHMPEHCLPPFSHDLASPRALAAPAPRRLPPPVFAQKRETIHWYGTQNPAKKQGPAYCSLLVHLNDLVVAAVSFAKRVVPGI